MRKNKFIAILFILGLSVVIYPHVAQYVNNILQKEQVHQFKETTQAMPSNMVTEQTEEAKLCNEEIFSSNPGMEDPFTEGYSNDQYDECAPLSMDDNHGYGKGFGAIEIPKLDLEIPIYLGADEQHLSMGVGQVEGSSIPVGGLGTHTVLAGHRGMGVKEMFRNLDELKDGDEFYIYTLDDKLTYRVYDKEVILPFETEILDLFEEKDLATLITCHPYRSNTHRLAIQGERVD